MRAGGVEIGAGLERILALQLQQRRDVDQHFRYLVLVHAWNMVLNSRGSKPKTHSPAQGPASRHLKCLW